MDDVGDMWGVLAAAPDVFWALVVGTVVLQLVIWYASEPARRRLRRLAGKGKGGAPPRQRRE